MPPVLGPHRPQTAAVVTTGQEWDGPLTIAYDEAASGLIVVLRSGHAGRPHQKPRQTSFRPPEPPPRQNQPRGPFPAAGRPLTTQGPFTASITEANSYDMSSDQSGFGDDP